MAITSWLKSLVRKSNQPLGKRQAPAQSRRPRPVLEALEDRLLPTAYLFVDFGDNFPLVGGKRQLNTTVGAIRDVASAQLDNAGTPIANTVVQGPQLSDNTGTNFADSTTVPLTNINYTAAQRAQIMALVRRAYASVDVTVVELTPTAQTLADGRSVTAASSMAALVAPLRANGTTSKDTYVIAAASPFSTNGYIGISPGGTILGETTDLSVGANNHDDLALAFMTNGIDYDSNTIAHEAGHCFGLQHAVTTSA